MSFDGLFNNYQQICSQFSILRGALAAKNVFLDFSGLLTDNMEYLFRHLKRAKKLNKFFTN